MPGRTGCPNESIRARYARVGLVRQDCRRENQELASARPLFDTPITAIKLLRSQSIPDSVIVELLQGINRARQALKSERIAEVHPHG